MKVLYIGDIMGRPGRTTVKNVLPELVKEHGVDFVVAQGENLSDGKGMQLKAVEDMLESGIDFFTGGNWTAKRSEITPGWKTPKSRSPDQPIWQICPDLVTKLLTLHMENFCL